MKQFLSDVNLRKIPKRQTDQVADVEPFYALFYGSNGFGSYYGPSLDVKTDTGQVGFSDPNISDKWQKWELTPECCRALKKHIWQKFGPKLRALHIPPPQ